MKVLFTALLVIFLVGCSTPQPLTVPFPDAPEPLTHECEKLSLLEQEALLSDIVRSVTTNYVKYHECSEKVSSWIEWHKSQKQIFDTAAKQGK